MKYIKTFEVKRDNGHLIYSDYDIKLLNDRELAHFNTRKYNQGDFVKISINARSRVFDNRDIMGTEMVYKVLGFLFDNYHKKGGFGDILYSVFYLDDVFKGWYRLDQLEPATSEEKELCELQMATNNYNL